MTPQEVEQIFSNDEIDVNYDVFGAEERWTVIGETNDVRVLVVVFTLRGFKIRVITAFDATKKLQREYFALKGR